MILLNKPQHARQLFGSLFYLWCLALLVRWVGCLCSSEASAVEFSEFLICSVAYGDGACLSVQVSCGSYLPLLWLVAEQKMVAL